MKTDVGTLLEIAVAVARRAAETARTMRDQAIEQFDTKSTKTDVVTEADRAVERQIVGELARLRPGDAVLGEEYGGAVTEARIRWVVDPIDGTVNYLYGLPQYAVSIAAELDGVAVAGVVRNAVTGAEWTATRGGGAWRDGRRLTGSTETDLSQALAATGFGYAAERRAHQAAVLAGVITRVRDIRRFGSAALDLCAAAEGLVDVYWEQGLAPWDLAAGGLIAEEAGLLVTGLNGAPPSDRLVIAAPPPLHTPLHAHLAAADAAGGP